MDIESFTNELIVDYIEPKVNEIVENDYNFFFEDNFKSFCEISSKEYSDLSATFKQLKIEAKTTVMDYFNNEYEKIDTSKCCETPNRFCGILYDLLYRFYNDIDFDYLINRKSAELFEKKFSELYKLGIIDGNGDFIKQ